VSIHEDDPAVVAFSDAQLARLKAEFPDPLHQLAAAQYGRALFEQARDTARSLRKAMTADEANHIMRVALREAAATAEWSHAESARRERS
jgi:hypothetical protein